MAAGSKNKDNARHASCRPQREQVVLAGTGQVSQRAGQNRAETTQQITASQACASGSDGPPPRSEASTMHTQGHSQRQGDEQPGSKARQPASSTMPLGQPGHKTARPEAEHATACTTGKAHRGQDGLGTYGQAGSSAPRCGQQKPGPGPRQDARIRRRGLEAGSSGAPGGSVVLEEADIEWDAADLTAVTRRALEAGTKRRGGCPAPGSCPGHPS
jgi:hypothetical protein